MKSKYEALLAKLLKDIDTIDKDTPWQSVEPEWWLDMMKLREEAQTQVTTNKQG